MRCLAAWIACAGWLLCAAEKKEQVPGQRPLLIVNGQFQWVEGSWGRYRIDDTAKKESYTMIFSVLNTEKKKRVLLRWLEIDVTLKGQPRVVTRILTEETKDGPGRLEDVIVQVAGYAPFRVPKRMMGKEGSVAQAAPVIVESKVEQVVEKAAGREIPAWRVEARDKDGKTVRAAVSEQVAPLGVVWARSESMEMRLEDWGSGAKTSVQGAVRPFWVWVMEAVAEGGKGSK
jgi:hypothetical protein